LDPIAEVPRIHYGLEKLQVAIQLIKPDQIDHPDQNVISPKSVDAM
jgi:hypothetical protein